MSSDTAAIRAFFGLPESPHKTAYFAFGRFQPPTLGHRRVFEKMKALTGDSADYFIVPSATCDLPDLDVMRPSSAKRPRTVCKILENPLPFEVKLDLLQKMYPSDREHLLDIEPMTKKINELIQHAQTFHGISIQLPKKPLNRAAITVAYTLFLCGYTEVYFVVGSDRIPGFQWLYDNIHNEAFKGTTGLTFDLVSAGERKKDPDDPIAGISGTNVRLAAAACDFTAFAKDIPEPTAIFTRGDQCTMFHALRKGFPSGKKKEPCAPVECREV
jgi:nicotinic acid mononucleotide adenylyltransferase